MVVLKMRLNNSEEALKNNAWKRDVDMKDWKVIGHRLRRSIRESASRTPHPPGPDSELIDWLKLLMADDIPDEILKSRDPNNAIPPLYGALLKNEQDVHMLQRLAFMARRERPSS